MITTDPKLLYLQAMRQEAAGIEACKAGNHRKAAMCFALSAECYRRLDRPVDAGFMEGQRAAEDRCAGRW